MVETCNIFLKIYNITVNKATPRDFWNLEITLLTKTVFFAWNAVFLLHAYEQQTVWARIAL